MGNPIGVGNSNKRKVKNQGDTQHCGVENGKGRFFGHPGTTLTQDLTLGKEVRFQGTSGHFGVSVVAS